MEEVICGISEEVRRGEEIQSNIRIIFQMHEFLVLLIK
jgi:hypothetical protein